MYLRFKKNVLLLSIFLYALPSFGNEIQIYSGSFETDIFEHNGSYPFEIYGEIFGNTNSQLRIRTEIKSKEILLGLGKLLESEIRKNDNGCKERWSAWGGAASIQSNSLKLRVTTKIEKWACEKVFGSLFKTKLAQETGTIHVTIKPEVVAGGVEVRVTDFFIKDLGEIARQLGAEQKVKQALLLEIDKFNKDPNRAALPNEFSDLDFVYEDISLRKDKLSLSFTGPNRLLELISLIAQNLPTN